MTDRPTSTIAFTIFLLQFISSTCLVAQNTSKSSSSLRKGRRSGTEFQCGQAPLLEDDETPIVLRRAQLLQVVSGQLPGYQTNIVNGQSAPRQVSNFWWFSFSAKVQTFKVRRSELYELLWLLRQPKFISKYQTTVSSKKLQRKRTFKKTPHANKQRSADLCMFFKFEL